MLILRSCQQVAFMSTSYELFLKWRELKKFPSDRSAALELCGSQSTVNGWKMRGSNAEAHLIERMCKDLGQDPIPYIMRAFEEAAKGDAKRALSRILKNYSKNAIVVFGCVFALGMLQEAHASTQGAIESIGGAHPIHYAKYRRRRRSRRFLRCMSKASTPLAFYIEQDYGLTTMHHTWPTNELVCQANVYLEDKRTRKFTWSMGWLAACRQIPGFTKRRSRNSETARSPDLSPSQFAKAA